MLSARPVPLATITSARCRRHRRNRCHHYRHRAPRSRPPHPRPTIPLRPTMGRHNFLHWTQTHRRPCSTVVYYLCYPGPSIK